MCRSGLPFAHRYSTFGTRVMAPLIDTWGDGVTATTQLLVPELHTASSLIGQVDLQDPSALPRRFHSSAVVSTPHPCDCLRAWDARKHRDRRQRRPGPADAAVTCELDALRRGAAVRPLRVRRSRRP